MLSNAPKRAVERLFEKNSDFILPKEKVSQKALLWAFERLFFIIKKDKNVFFSDKNVSS